MKGSRLRLERGVGLIEVLITLLIISTALMGLAVLQTRSLQYNQDSFFRSQANILAGDIFDRMRIYTSASASWPSAGSEPVLSTEAKTDIQDWSARVAETLPEGEGTIACTNATRMCTVTISWTELNSDKETDIDSDEEKRESSFTYTARL